MIERSRFVRYIIPSRSRRSRLPAALGCMLLTGTTLAGASCAHAQCPPELMAQERSRVDPELLRLAEVAPDSVVGVLIRLERPLSESETDELREAGLAIGAVAGTIVTAQARACDGLRAAQHPAVRHIELARPVPLPTPVPGSTTP
jgi:hypothetical protein